MKLGKYTTRSVAIGVRLSHEQLRLLDEFIGSQRDRHGFPMQAKRRRSETVRAIVQAFLDSRRST